MSGENKFFFGKTYFVDTLTKMIEIQKSINRIEENNPMYGKTFSTYTKTLMSKAKIGENNPASKSVYIYLFDPETKDLILF